MTNRVLSGVVRLNSAEDTNYTLVLSNNPTGIQNQIAPIGLEEAFIEVDTTAGDVYIYLPPIANFNGGWSPKIFVTATAGGNSVYIYPFNNETPNSDTVNGSYSYGTVDLNETVYLHITEKHNWGVWESCPTVVPA